MGAAVFGSWLNYRTTSEVQQEDLLSQKVTQSDIDSILSPHSHQAGDQVALLLRGLLEHSLQSLFNGFRIYFRHL
ncbi:hypothetical protein ABH892_001068 [Paenibacillus sp. RC254]